MKTVLEDDGFSLPEPLYRVRVDGGPVQLGGDTAKTPPPSKPKKSAAKAPQALNTEAELTIVERVAEERAKVGDGSTGATDLLSDHAPQE